MCGRFVLTATADALAAEFAAKFTPWTGGLVLAPRYNVAPMTGVVVVRQAEGRRELAVLRWGLVPSWARDETIAARLLNARSETAATKPSFRDAMRRRRAVVPATGFYEWKKQGSRRQPWYFHHREPARSLAIAALWEAWQQPDGGVLETCCLLTTAANAVLAPVHDRMPVLLDEAGMARWLDPDARDPATLADLLHPAPEQVLTAHPVSTAVSRVANDDPSNIEPIDEAAIETASSAKNDPQGSLF
jgi:putative SOS response-associated peptidase YedK